MVFPIYFSHGYREREAQYNEYFGLIMQQHGFIPSIDPPSEDVSAAKLERHLKYTSGLVAIVAKRKEGISKYILYEIYMCLRSNKPVMVFLEDNLPDNTIPQYILQARFSTRSFAREVYEHMNSLEIFRKYIGDIPLPKYQLISKQKSCLLLGFEENDIKITGSAIELLEERGFRVININKDDNLPLNPEIHTEINKLDLVLVIQENLSPTSNYLFGAIRAIQIPTIVFATSRLQKITDKFPTEFQFKYLPTDNSKRALKVIDDQIELFEEDFVELDKKDQVAEYINALASAFPLKGAYSAQTRSQIMNQITLGDNFDNISDSILAIKSDIKDSLNKN